MNKKTRFNQEFMLAAAIFIIGVLLILFVLGLRDSDYQLPQLFEDKCCEGLTTQCNSEAECLAMPNPYDVFCECKGGSVFMTKEDGRFVEYCALLNNNVVEKQTYYEQYCE